jgi:hypothetical protein
MAARGHAVYVEHLDRILPALAVAVADGSEVSFG